MHYTIEELETETAVALPERQLMSLFSNNWAGIYASSSAVALNAATVLSAATAFSGQSISVNQL